MKIFLSMVCLIILLSGMRMKNEPVYSVKSSPVQDTLVSGIDNELEILKNGEPYFDRKFHLTLSGGTLQYYGDGVYIARVPDGIGQAQFGVSIKAKKIIDKTFITRPK
jgi:hypothetical protein